MSIVINAATLIPKFLTSYLKFLFSMSSITFLRLFSANLPVINNILSSRSIFLDIH